MVLVFWILALGCNAFGGGFVVGNGGEGLEIGNELYVRDLVEAGVERFPYVGPRIDSAIEERLQFLPIDQFSLPFSKDLLARKLTDIEQAHSGLGHYIFEAIKSYTWLGVHEPLASIPDPAQVLKPSGSHVQIANRDDSTIRVHIENWKRLSEEHKIALIIHEAVYGLLLPICDEGPNCYQPARRARSITGLFFFDFFFSKRSSIALRVLPYIDVPQGFSRAVQRSRYWRLSWQDPNSNQVHETALKLPMSYESFAKEITDACKMVPDAAGIPSGQSIMSSLDLRPYSTRMVQYQTTYTSESGKKVVGYQMRLSIQSRSGNLKNRITYVNRNGEDKCRSALFRHYKMAIKQD